MIKHFSKIGILIIVATFFLVVVSIAFFTLYKEILETKNNNKVLSSEVLTDTKKSLELDAIQKNLKLTVADSKSLNSFFIAKGDEVDFITNVESIAKSHRLKISTNNIDLKTTEPLSNINKGLLSITIETLGSWKDTMTFLKLLSDLPYDISITSTNLSYGEFTDTTEGNKTSGSTTPKTWKTKIDFNVVRNLN